MSKQLSLTVTSSATKFLDQNLGRRMLVIQNQGAPTLRIGLGAVENAAAGVALTLAQNVIWNPAVTPTDAIYLASSGADIVVVVIED